MTKPIEINELTLSFPHKTCFEGFTSTILPGSRIALIGANGSGKSTCINLLRGAIEPLNGTIRRPEGLKIGYVPQLIKSEAALSGGERFNQALTQALSNAPDVLLLDEPTNHLDRHNRRSLLRLLRHFAGTVIVASHDPELLNHCIDTIWHIDNQKIQVFKGRYDDYRRQMEADWRSMETTLTRLKHEKKASHLALMKEQTRASKSREHGRKAIQNRKWPTVKSPAKVARANDTAHRKQASIDKKKQALVDKMDSMCKPEIIQPNFRMVFKDTTGHLLSIHQGSIGFSKGPPLLQGIELSMMASDRLAIKGRNGSGKTSLVKAILGEKALLTTGEWILPMNKDIGYLDQHYENLDSHKSVFEAIHETLPTQEIKETRRHLNDFLFRKNEEVEQIIDSLSGGERARLSLAKIAAKPPRLLILDEITNNLDYQTRDHVIQVMREYPGAILVISHDEAFLKAIRIEDSIDMEKHAVP